VQVVENSQKALGRRLEREVFPRMGFPLGAGVILAGRAVSGPANGIPVDERSGF